MLCIPLNLNFLMNYQCAGFIILWLIQPEKNNVSIKELFKVLFLGVLSFGRH